jgi:N-carbamoylputrescine amidase
MDTPFGRIGIMLCYDRDFPEAARSLAVRGAELLIVPNGASRQLTDMWVRLMSVRAYENQMAVLGCSLTGRADKEHHEFCGNSLYADPFGTVQAQLGFEEDVLVIEHDPLSVEAARRQRFMHRDRRPEIYGLLTEMTMTI